MGIGGENSPDMLSGFNWVARPPGGPHVCTLFNHLPLLVRHDLHKFRDSGAETVTQALKLDFHVLCPALQIQYPDLDEWLVTNG